MSISASSGLSALAPDLTKTCHEYLARFLKKFRDEVTAGVEGTLAGAHYCKAIDGLLSSLFCASYSSVRAENPTLKGKLSLVALGGYGRGLLAPYSDVDLLFLCEGATHDQQLESLAERFLYPLWEIGFDVGHVVRSVDETLELAIEDIRTSTTLSDVRLVAGDRTLVEELRERGKSQVLAPHLKSFVESLTQDMALRHGRFGGSLYLLEPDIKYSRGGLRDIDIIHWMMHARWGHRTLEQRVDDGVLSQTEAAALRDAKEFLFRVRNWLHFRAGRRQDRLSFSDQEEIAERLGFQDGMTLAVENLMHAYYVHAQAISTLAERMASRVLPRSDTKPLHIHSLGNGLVIVDDSICIDKKERILVDPPLAFRVYRQALKHQKKIDYETRDAISAAATDATWCGKLRYSEEATQLFLSLLTTVQSVPFARNSIASELHDVGLLRAMIPEFEQLQGRVYYDVYHIYTVDVHAIAALDQFRALARGEANNFSTAQGIAAEVPRRSLIMLAILLHSIGAFSSHQKAAASAKLASQICHRLGFNDEDCAYIAWLIQSQDLMYRAATQRDIYDAQVRTELMNKVQNEHRLRELYLLTIAITSTVNPDAVAEWKARALEDLYLAVATSMSTGDLVAQREERAASVKAEVAVGFEGDAAPETLRAFLDEMPDRYFLANPVDQIRRHARMARDKGDDWLSVRIAAGPSEDLDELVVMTEDRPRLLADIAAVLAANCLSVVAAEIYTRRRPGHKDEAFDIFLVRSDPEERVDAEALQVIRRDLEERLTERVSAAELIGRSSYAPAWSQRVRPQISTQVSVDNDASSQYTVVDVFTKDRAGLLHEIAQTLYEKGLSIALSKINTEGDRVADVFYVADERGHKIRDTGILEDLQQSIYERVQLLHEKDSK